MMTSKKNRAFEVMLKLFKDETTTFALNSRYFSHGVSNPPMPPVLRCRMPRGGGRCRGVVSQLALTQMCSNCQVRNPGDLNINDLRCLSTSDQGFYQLVFGRRHIRRRLA